MDFWIDVVNILIATMETPTVFGWYHILWLCITAGMTVLLCTRFRNCDQKTVQNVVFWTAAVVTLLEVYKQTAFSVAVTDGAISWNYQWYAFPWQFCSTPMYVGLLTGIFRRGRIHDALYAYLATFVVFAGLCVMIYPGDVYMYIIGINIQTMICHSSMLIVGIWLLVNGAVPLGYRTVWKACGVFCAGVAIAVVLNEAFWYSGILGEETFNMFFISNHFPSTLPIYSTVQELVHYPWCLLLYIAAFSLAAFAVMFAAIMIRNLSKKAARQPAAQH